MKQLMIPSTGSFAIDIISEDDEFYHCSGWQYEHSLLSHIPKKHCHMFKSHHAFDDKFDGMIALDGRFVHTVQHDGIE